MTVVDDGRGFDAGKDSDALGGHFGLRAMESLTEDAGGSFRIDSVIGEGTKINVEVPV